MAWKRPKPGRPVKREWQTTLLIATTAVLAGIVTGDVLTGLFHGLR